jgi:hypothetical protein
MICGIIAPRQEDVVGYRQDGYLAECILLQGHLSPHVVKTPEGKFMAWQDDFECGCCTGDDDDRCTVYWEITESEISNLSKRQT